MRRYVDIARDIQHTTLILREHTFIMIQVILLFLKKTFFIRVVTIANFSNGVLPVSNE